jgi:hypothetical protein
MKCIKKGSHHTGLIENGDTNFAAVYMQAGPDTNRKKCDIDLVGMNEESEKAFYNHPSFSDARSESFGVGEGMALVFSLPEDQRKAEEDEEEWTLHAAAVVLKNNNNNFMLVAEKFGSDEQRLFMADSWELRAYSDAAGFINYWNEEGFPSHPPYTERGTARYRLWKLTAQERDKTSKGPAKKTEGPLTKKRKLELARH